MITVIELILAGFMGWIASFVFLDYYESERPKQKIEVSEIENFKKGIQRAKVRLSVVFGMFTAITWLVIFRWMNYSN